MPGNNYGNANPLPLPAIYTPTGDIACAAGTETTVITSGALTAISPGFYYPYIQLWLAILLGATPPTAMQVAFKLGAGSDVDTFVIAPAVLVANATVQIGVPLLGASSSSAWSGAGSTVNITVNATGQAVTAKQVGSRAIVILERGPDA